MDGGIRTDERGPVFTITLDRPPVNVLDLATLRRLHDVVRGLAAHHARVVILRSGLDTVFSGGMNVADHEPGRAPDMLREVHGLFLAWEALPQSTVAVVDGRCRGGAFELLLLCDAVFATSRSDFAFPEIGLGCFPPAAVALLPSIVGRASAALVLTGATVSAAEASRLGLVSLADDPEAAAQSYAACVASQSGVAVAQARRALREAGGLPLAERLRRAEQLYAELMKSEDAAEGVRAFLQKRTPVWKHR